MGHSTRSLEELIDLLIHHGAKVLVDVRTVPASRRMPHFAKAALDRSLAQRGIRYLHMPELGGLRTPKSDSINTGWRNVGFRGYADHMQTDEFWAGIERLMNLPIRPGRFPAGSPSPASGEGKVVMCAEAVPWRCHRSLLSDALTVRGVEVRHITSRAEPARHALTPFAHVRSGRITYPAPDTLGL